MNIPDESRKDGMYHPFRTISRKLVKYRLGSGDTTGGTYRKFMSKGIRRSLEARRQALADLEESAKSWLPADYYETLKKLYAKAEQQLANEVDLWDGDSFAVRWRGYQRIFKWGSPFSRYRIIQKLLLLPKWMTNLIFALIRH